MWAKRYWGPRYFGARYWGTGGDAPPPPDTAQKLTAVVIINQPILLV